MNRFLHALPYSIGFIFPTITFSTLIGWIEFSWFVPIIAFIAIPVLDQVLPFSEDNLSKEETAALQDSPLHSLLLMVMLPIQWALIATLCYNLTTTTWSELNGHWVGMIFSMGICCGTFGINVAHELGHRNDKLSQFCAKGLLLSSLYMHFIIEHNRGHHRHVATDLDPATSKRTTGVSLLDSIHARFSLFCMAAGDTASSQKIGVVPQRDDLDDAPSGCRCHWHRHTVW